MHVINQENMQSKSSRWTRLKEMFLNPSWNQQDALRSFVVVYNSTSICLYPFIVIADFKKVTGATILADCKVKIASTRYNVYRKFSNLRSWWKKWHQLKCEMKLGLRKWGHSSDSSCTFNQKALHLNKCWIVV